MTVVNPSGFSVLPPDRPAAELEDEVLALWRSEDLFNRALEARAGGEPWVFFEGPPTANGLPGIHHVFARTIKDLFCRHRAMRGHFVRRKAGWDTHGLPVEIEVEKRLGISGKQDIERIGVEEFNRLCRESVWRYKDDWEKLSERIGYWLDYSDPYVTYTNPYVESVWWALATLFRRGLLYRGHKILPYCSRCGTALSSHEVALGYQEDHDPSVYVALTLRGEGTRRILVWTTTPWTLVSNTALAVNPELEYVELRKRGGDDATLILAASRAAAVLGDDWSERWETVRTLAGTELAGLRYERPLDWVDFDEQAGEHGVIIAESFVSAGDGSGVVHLAPAFGADDYAAGQRHGLAFVQPVNARGEFPAEMPIVGGKFVKDADPLIVEELKRRGVLWKAGTIAHEYPHCWRCGTPLLYYARSSWFVRTTAYRDEMLARNARVQWQPPEAGERRFGDWLINNVDWAISRDRYWGTPLPLWVCEADDSHVEAVGSYAELAARSGQSLGDEFDPHKPYIDRYTWPCEKCGGTMRRVPEVIDTWFDSGSMPFAQWHFPFDNREMFEEQYPADFIAEGVDQTRGWFYSLLAIAAGLGDAMPKNAPVEGTAADASTAPYRACVVNEHVLDAHGVKMSKRLGNLVDPWEMVRKYGADAVRLFLVSTSQIWVRRRFDENAIRETAGRFLLTLKNVYGFFALYANFGWASSPLDPAPGDRQPIDRWALSRLATVEREVDELLGRFEPTEAARLIMELVVDDVSNWYVRLNRARFYDVDGDDNRAAFATLHEILMVVCRLLAPLTPFVTDWMHRELTGESVHLAPYTRGDGDAGGRSAPRGSVAAIEPALEAAMAEVRALATLGRAAREEAGVKVRQPLAELICVVPDPRVDLTELIPLLRNELNVKRVRLVTSADALVTLEAKPNFRALGKKFGKSTPLAAQAVAALSSDALRAFEHGEPLAISVGNESRTLDPEDLVIVRRAVGELVVKEEHRRFAAIDPTVTPELRLEGLARELVSRVQRMRKEAGFAVSDRIRLAVDGNDELVQAVRTYRDWIASETLAVEVAVGSGAVESFNAVHSVDIDEGVAARIALTREP